MKKQLLFLFLLLGLSMQAQRLMQTREKAFNFGMKASGTSALPVVTTFTMEDGSEIEDVQFHYEVGYAIEIFGRVNVNRIFLQPSVIWSYSKGAMSFVLPDSELPAKMAASADASRYNFSICALEVPVFIGYNLVKETPYALSMMMGAKVRYNYRIKYEGENVLYDYMDGETKYNVAALAGVSVSIGRIFFDANYEFGLRELRSSFVNLASSAPEARLTLKKRMNAINVSFGFIF
ncbi:porin family protein [Parabacteroides sp. Marseille-P3160]|uniref:porin family protein n=1 Tax=Parabacteroides sp. Marseille-P3160 TaxID=1917887 RepID=UPI0009BA9BF3|nr:porin family protein [Parabacteroides sp. Marseille-P3160]